MTVHANFLICEYLVELFSVSIKNSLILFFLIFHHKKKIIFFSWFWCFSNSAVIWQFHLEALFLWSYSHWRHDWGWMMQFYGWQLVLEVGGRHWFHSVNLLECPHGMGTGLFQRKQSKRAKFLWPSLRSTTWWFSPYSVGHTSRL